MLNSSTRSHPHSSSCSHGPPPNGHRISSQVLMSPTTQLHQTRSQRTPTFPVAGGQESSIAKNVPSTISGAIGKKTRDRIARRPEFISENVSAGDETSQARLDSNWVPSRNHLMFDNPTSPLGGPCEPLLLAWGGGNRYLPPAFDFSRLREVHSDSISTIPTSPVA